MPKIDPKSIIEHVNDLEVIRPEAYARMLKAREKTFFRTAAIQTDGPLNLYSTDDRMVMAEDDTLEENLTLLLGLRPENVSMVFSLMAEGAALYSIDHRYLNGAVERFQPHLVRMTNNYGLIVQSVIESAKANVRASRDFRGTLAAKFTTGVMIRYDGQDIKLEFLTKIMVYQMLTLNMERTFSGPEEIDMAPKLVDRFTFDIIIPDFAKPL